MERIKKLEEVILRPDALLVEIIEIKPSSIKLLGIEDSKDALDYMVVVAVGSGVDDYQKGDYVLDMAPVELGVYSIDGKKYALLYRGNIRIGVKKDNFDLTTKDVKGNNLSV